MILVGILYHSGFISGRSAGSFVHWMIRTVVFVAIWAVTYGVIWIKQRNKLVKVPVKVEENENR